jgi:hypothetical protein
VATLQAVNAVPTRTTGRCTARGTFCLGSFTATFEAQQLSRAAHRYPSTGARRLRNQKGSALGSGALMDEVTGEHSQPVFAAEGRARHRLVRAAVAAGLALLASWLIALALGVLGGFDGLPGLPGSQPKGANASGTRLEATHPDPIRARPSQPRAQTRLEADAVRTPAPAPVSRVPSPNRPQSPTPKTKTVSQAPAAPSSPAPANPASNGRGQGITRTTPGKPADTPGNGPGGAGGPGGTDAPGQLR